MKVVINRCYGGFSLSEVALVALRKRETDKTFNPYSYDGKDRTDPNLVAVVEALGKKANGRFADLEVVEIPDGIEWEIDEYDGAEEIHEKHRSW